ncbi:MAG: FmdB family transcriptional regulator [Acidimicrobiales bacterium]|nr:MAG: FmdB family transcriptional regulator [Acidimicrobiales bacterium]
MPTYDYRCGVCDAVFEMRRPMAESSESATCPDGHDGARRMLSVFAAVGSGSTPGQGGSVPVSGRGLWRCMRLPPGVTR